MTETESSRGTTRKHHMPFGVELMPDKGVRFRLWAPSAADVDLCLQSLEDDELATEHRLAMDPGDDGWFSLTTDEAEPGARYRFRIDGDLKVPDPASRFQPDDVHGTSEVIDPASYRWRDGDWKGRPWEEAIVYELHVGTFTPAGTFAGCLEKLDYLADLGVTAIELMPVADFPGARNWGYDGVSLFAPDSRYGRPEDLKALVDAAHGRGLMVFLDVVYNHFGPEGNYLHAYAKPFFDDRHQTPWGAALNFDGPDSRWVREFFVHNALYWLEEYHLDGLRLDAVHAIRDASPRHVLEEIAQAVQAAVGDGRHVHLVLENDENTADYLERTETGRPRFYAAQWNDDIHHAFHVALTGEGGGYYTDYAEQPVELLARCLTEGFAYQGEASRHRDGAARGQPSGHLPAVACVSFLQNHDQVGNRAFGERIHALVGEEPLRAAVATCLLAPAPPLLFMGQEWGSTQPFLFFCDLGEDLADQVTEGRRSEFSRFPEFRDPSARARIPDPMAGETFTSCILDWDDLYKAPHDTWLAFHQKLLTIRRRDIVPRLCDMPAGQAAFEMLGERAFRARWPLADGSSLVLLANFHPSQAVAGPRRPAIVLFDTHAAVHIGGGSGGPDLLPWSALWGIGQDEASA
jgi:1,4-alpha-glucan branching enzyme/maltooligosyltrehalose trehalohydrolase